MRAIGRVVSATVILAVLSVSACSTQNRASSDTTSKTSALSSSSVPSDTPPGRSRIEQLEAEARALAKATGCNSATACRTAPVGERGCGGPRDYIVYCAATTDSVALFKKLDELKAAEIEFNKNSGMMSTCEFRMAPETAVVGGRCRAASTP